MYLRSTRAAALGDLPSALAEKIRAHAAAHQLVLEGVRVWWTHSENPPAEGFLGRLLGRRANSADPDAAHDTVLVLHPTHLLVATAGEKRGVAAMSLPLVQASMTRGSALAARMGVAGGDDGMTLSGFAGEAGRPGTYFVGLGRDAAGEACAGAVEAALVAAKNPR